MGAESITWEEILEIVGPEAAAALGKRYGGVSKYIPRDPTKGKLSKNVGLEAAKALSARFGGSTLMFPNTTRRPTPKKVRIIELIEAGWSVRRIAMRVRCTEDWVKIVKRQYRNNINRA